MDIKREHQGNPCYQQNEELLHSFILTMYNSNRKKKRKEKEKKKKEKKEIPTHQQLELLPLINLVGQWQNLQLS